ncbi:endonuclease domain-containing protein [Pseudolysobacter antarcticus]|uniref:UDP-N-acetyl-alpha-D-muramoyl-L-alanyl-L-glutamate epimerase n=1 Tax=Pseudolysobacter antarcticus TaxID=2511995 RepID=A0A411HH04_9GAMM|nr:UDP-N-acetyl-alpha-D-muramoyl-L-alanyl-L-glutamate epimerase [Pseudolysobacter antarcticus]QBB69697.1 endonuclease domain-containing protein [Pseudolysobacter antarcticus]
MLLNDPCQAATFRFVGCSFDASSGEAQLRYAFDDGAELIERIVFPEAPTLDPARRAAFDAALKLLHLIAGVSYFKAGVPAQIRVEKYAIDRDTADLLDELYLQGLGEFAYQNKLDLRGKIRFPVGAENATAAVSCGLPRRSLVPIGGGKDSLVSVELLKKIGEPATAVWVGNSALIAACAQATGLPMLNIQRQIAPELFELNRQGAWNGHIPVTAINSAILVVAAILYGFDAIAFSNEHSASSATLEYDGQAINHQWSKSFTFERRLHTYLQSHVAADLDYFSLLRPLSELAVTKRFAHLTQYHALFSSCNRNFRILGTRPADRWCGQCPKCHFVFLALAPFCTKPQLVQIFGRNLLDDESQTAGFDALLEYRHHKPFECVGEGRESRAAMYTLSQRAEWREDAIVQRFTHEILPQLDVTALALAPLLQPAAEHLLPARLTAVLDASG